MDSNETGKALDIVVGEIVDAEIVHPTPDELEFNEDMEMMAILANRLVRRASVACVQLNDPPQIEMAARDALGSGEYRVIVRDLDMAREGRTDVDDALIMWERDRQRELT